jgi:hypothetical protein
LLLAPAANEVVAFAANSTRASTTSSTGATTTTSVQHHGAGTPNRSGSRGSNSDVAIGVTLGAVALIVGVALLSRRRRRRRLFY